MRSLYSLALLGCAAAAGAQVDTTRRDTVLLAPTVVTVTRIPLELSRVPLAVGVTSRDEIQRGKPGFALDEALAGIAGVQVDNRFNYALGERISIRGFGARAQFGVRGVRVLLDGIPMTLADGQTTLNNVDVSTVTRAEVIRGPASAGRSEPTPESTDFAGSSCGSADTTIPPRSRSSARACSSTGSDSGTTPRTTISASWSTIARHAGRSRSPATGASTTPRIREG